MSRAVGDHIRLSKQALFELAGDGFITQTRGEIIDEAFTLPQIDVTIYDSLPSIETFVRSSGGSVSATGSNEELNAVWMPVVDRLAGVVLSWAEGADVEFTGDAYITCSVTAANEVNGEAHFDDDQFDPAAGAGLVAIVGDLNGSSVASAPIPHEAIRPHQSVTASEEIKAAFGDGDFGRVDYGPNQLVALPQFGQLHSGPGPCGDANEVRHLMVFRASTKPGEP